MKKVTMCGRFAQAQPHECGLADAVRCDFALILNLSIVTTSRMISAFSF